METNPSSRTHRRAIVGGVIAAAVLGTLAARATETLAPLAGAELLAISSKLDARLSTVMIEATEPVAYVTSQPDPLTVLIDLRNVRAGVLAQQVGPLPPVTAVEVEDVTGSDGEPLARVRVRMDRPAAHKVRSSRNVIYVEVDRGALNPEAPPVEVAKDTKVTKEPGIAKANAAATIPPPALRAASVLRGVKPIPNGVSLTGDGELVASTVEQARDLPARVLLDFQGVSARGVPAVTDVNQGDIQRVRVGVNSRSPLVTRVVIDLVRQVAYRIEHAGNELRVLFDQVVGNPPSLTQAGPASFGVAGTAAAPAQTTGAAADRADPAAPVAPAPAPAAETRTEPVAPLAPAAAAVPAGAPGVPIPGDMRILDVQQTPAAPPPIIVSDTAQPTAAAPPQTRFTGPPVSLDFQNADLRAVLRTFAEISGLNIVIDPSINGTVDVSLRDVPWDQALDIILKANKLGYAVDGTVVRIAPLTVLAQEEEERRKHAEAQALAGDLRVLTMPLSYATRRELVPISHPQRAVDARRGAGRHAHQHADRSRPARSPDDGVRAGQGARSRRSRRWRSKRASCRRPATSRVRSACSGA